MPYISYSNIKKKGGGAENAALFHIYPPNIGGTCTA